MTMRQSVLGSFPREVWRPVVISAALVVLAVIALSPAPVQGEKPGAVVVVNEESQPVPVAGTLALAPGSQVGLTPGVTVDVGNTSANPVLVRNVDRNAAPEPFHLRGDAICTTGEVKGILGSNDTGKLMVVENVSFMVQIRKGFAVTAATISLGSAIPSVVFNVLPTPEIISTFSRYGGSAAVKAYIQPGGQAELSIAETSNGQCNLHFDIAGVLVDP